MQHPHANDNLHRLCLCVARLPRVVLKNDARSLDALRKKGADEAFVAIDAASGAMIAFLPALLAGSLLEVR